METGSTQDLSHGLITSTLLIRRRRPSPSTGFHRAYLQLLLGFGRLVTASVPFFFLSLAYSRFVSLNIVFLRLHLPFQRMTSFAKRRLLPHSASIDEGEDWVTESRMTSEKTKKGVLR